MIGYQSKKNNKSNHGFTEEITESYYNCLLKVTGDNIDSFFEKVALSDKMLTFPKHTQTHTLISQKLGN